MFAKRKIADYPATSIALVYLAFSTIWILISDHIVNLLFNGPQQEVQTVKGLFFVSCSALLIYILAFLHSKRNHKVKEELEDKILDRTHKIQQSNTKLASALEELRVLNNNLYSVNEELQRALTRVEDQSRTILTQKDEQLNRVLENSQDVIFSIDLVNSDHYFSRNAKPVLGNNQELLKNDLFWINLSIPADRLIRKEMMDALKKHGYSEGLVRWNIGTDEYRWMFERHRMVFKNGTAIRHEAILTDISALKQAEKRLEEDQQVLQSLIDNLPDFIYVKDTSLNLQLINKRGMELLAQMQTDVWQMEELKNDRLVIEQGRSLINIESNLVTPNGEAVSMLITRVPLKDDSGKVSGLVTIGRDITELKRSEKLVKSYRENLDILFSNTTENILLLDHEGRVLLYNQAMEQAVKSIRGYGPQPGDLMWELTSSDRKEMSKEYTLKAIKGYSTRVDASIETAIGKAVFDVRYNPVLVGGQVKYIIVLSTDVTEKRLQETVLQRSQQNLDIIFSNTTEKILLLDYTGCVVMFNQAFADFARLTGRIPEEGELAWNFMTENDDDGRDLFLRALNGERFVIDRSVYIGEENFIHELHYLPVYTNGNVSHVTITSNDVTEKRKQEIALRQSEANLQGIFDGTNEVFILIDSEFSINTFNRAFVKSWLHENQNIVFKDDLAFDSEYIVGKNIFLFLPDTPINSTDIMLKLKAGEVVQFIWKVIDYDKTRWYQVTLQPIYSDKNIHGYSVTLINQTDVRKAKEKVLASELLFRSLIESSEDVFAIVNDQMVNLFVSPNVERVLGHLPNEMVGKSNVEFIHPDDLEKAKKDLQTIGKREGESMPIARRIRHKDGRWIFIEGIIINRFETVGIGGRLLIYHDVSDRKEKEDRISELNEALTDFQQAIYRSSIVSRANRKGIITYVNDNFVNISGYTHDELVGQNHRIINSDYHPQEFWAEMWRTISQGKIWRQEVRNKARDGSFYWVDTFIMPFFDENGDIREFLSIRNDITQRKKTEEELLHSRYMLDKANEVAKIGYWSYDVVRDKLDCNEQALALLDFKSHDQLSLRSLMENIHPKDAKRMDQFIRRKNKDAKVAIDYRTKPVNNVSRWLHAEAKEIVNEKGELNFILGIVQDITERKMIEEILREYNDRFEMVSKATNDAIWDWDIENDFEIWNQGIENIFGYKERTISQPNMWWKDKIHPNDYRHVSETIEMAFAHRESHWSASYRYKCADGSFKYVLDRAYILYKDDKPVRMIGAIQDITQQKEALKEIEKLSLVASKTSNAVVITDAAGKIEWTNKAFTELTGYTLDESVGKKPGEFLQGPKTDKACVSRISEALRTCQPIKEELINYDKRGRAYWVRIDIAPVFDNQQNLTHFIAVETDITDQKEYESNITAIARELTSLIENANVPIFGLDRNGYINEWNHVAANLSGFHRNEVLARKWSDFIQPRLQRNISIGIKRVFSGRAIVNFELPFINKAGKKLVFLMSVSPRRDIRNKIVGVICVAQDITEVSNYRYGLEQIVEARTKELNTALQKEKELVEMKTKFVSIASHEFRTPLASISMASGFLNRYRDRMTNIEIVNKLSIIDKQVEHMTVLLDDVLMIGKAEAGKISVTRKCLPMREFIERVVDDVRSGTQYSHLVRIFWPEELIEFYTDEKLMRNIIINLLNNAIKFSPEANVVDLKLEMLLDGMQLQVRDYGIGIPEEDRKCLFQTFQRGSNVSTIQGTGLGLSIVKKAIDLLGGSIAIESTVNDGTTFIVFIPFME